MSTPLLIKPTLDEVRLWASKIGLPEIEADKFFYFYESKNWRVGKNQMSSFPSALAGWKIRWQERQAPVNGQRRNYGEKRF